MARRSLGVVLIVALVGWTVNRPMQCQGQHSRAAVVLLAGASPAYQPEPSPTRHSCCPRESKSSVSPFSGHTPSCDHQMASHSDCCSVFKDSQTGLPATPVQKSSAARYALAYLLLFEPVAPVVREAPLALGRDSAEVQLFSSTVLRL
jgi:hypothetical protein